MLDNNLTETSKKISQIKSQLKSGLLSWGNWIYSIITLTIFLWSILINKIYPDETFSLYSLIIFIGMIYIFPFMLGFYLKILLQRDLDNIKKLIHTWCKILIN